MVIEIIEKRFNMNNKLITLEELDKRYSEIIKEYLNNEYNFYSPSNNNALQGEIISNYLINCILK